MSEQEAPKCPHHQSPMFYREDNNRWHCHVKTAGVYCDFWVDDEDADKFRR